MYTQMSVAEDFLQALEDFFGNNLVVTMGGEDPILYFDRSNPVQSRIWIRDAGNLSREDLSSKPGLAVDVGNSRAVHAAMGDLLTYNFFTASETVLSQELVPVVIHCCSEIRDEAQKLARMAKMAILLMRPQLFETEAYNTIRFDTIGNASMIQAGGPEDLRFDVPVLFSVSMHDSFTVRQKEPVMAGVEVEVTQHTDGET